MSREERAVIPAGFSFFRLVSAFSADVERSADAQGRGDWAHLRDGLGKHDARVVLEMLSPFVDQHGGVSFSSFYGCIRALVEASLS